MGQARVLVVDDERFFREAIQDVLSAAGLECLLASTGEEALEVADDPTLGAVVLDLQLPDLHGLEVFRRLRERRRDLRVVILSAHTDQDNVLEALRLGAFDYLAKPLHEEELSLAVGRALETFALVSGWTGLRTRLARLEERLEALWELARGGAAEAEALPRAAAEAVADVLGATKTSLLRVDAQDGALRVAAAHGRKLPAEEMDAMAVGEGVAGAVLARAEPLLVTDVASDERWAARVPADRYATPSFVVAPLVAGGRPLGVLCATDRVGGAAFGEDDLSLLRILSAQVARMLDPERPPATEEADETQELPAGSLPSEADAASAETRAELAQAVCDALTAEVEPARVLDAVLRPVAARLGAAPVSLYLLDPTDGALAREAECDGGARTDRPRLPAGRGLAGVVLETGQLVASDAPSEDPRFDADVDTPADGAPGPILCGPLRFRGKTLGIFRVFPESGEAASAGVGEVLGAALSAAIRNVLLYRSLVDTIEEVAQARREASLR